MRIDTVRRYVLITYFFLCENLFLFAQQVDTLQIKTSAKENPTATFRCRVPAQYDQSSKVKYRLLVYFGGRNTTGEHEVKNPTWTNWCDKNGVFLIVPSYKNDNYWEPQKWSGKALLEAIAQLKKKYPNICDGKLLSELKYFYSKSGKLTSRLANGKLQEYKYDAKNQLLAVIDMESKSAVEEYVYDASGNILKKTVNGKTTTYTYDAANQLANSVSPDGKITDYVYDAAGRLVKEGEKTYEYGWLDKVMRVAEDGKELAHFEYHNNNQLAKAIRESGVETFEWDGLALIERNGVKYINEPHAGGGNPILATTSAPNVNSLTSPSQSQTIFTDMLGTSLGTVKNNAYSEIEKTAFGNLFSESAQLAKSLSSANTFFTGKPYVEDLGYVFLLRNYRADMGKWLSQDLIGYPDGWNDLAYCNNHILECVDYNGLWTVQIGVTLSGGSLLGGSISFGIAIGHSTESGYTTGFYSSASGGMDAGYSIGASITGTHTGYGSIDVLSGTAVSVGGSLGLKLGAGFNIGGEANIPSEAKTFDPFGYSINVGFSTGVPVEIHSMITETVIHKLIDTGGTVTSIKE